MYVASCINLSHYRSKEDVSICLNQQEHQECTHNQDSVNCPRFDGNPKDLGLHREFQRKEKREGIETSLQLPLHEKPLVLGSQLNKHGWDSLDFCMSCMNS